MLILLLAMLQASQTPPIVKPVGPPVSAAPHDPAVWRTADNTVLGTVGAFDADQIESTTLATAKARAADVKAYAAALLKDHQKSLTAGTKLARRLDVTRLLPPDSVMARAHKDEMFELNGVSGAPFDKVFVQHMVDDHKAAILKLTSFLTLPAAQKDVKQFVREVLPTMKAHLQIGEKWLAAHPSP